MGCWGFAKGHQVCIISTKSNTFTVGVGLFQGYPLSPVLFVIFTDRISMHSCCMESVRLQNFRNASLLIVDDVVLLSWTGLGQFCSQVWSCLDEGQRHQGWRHCSLLQSGGLLSLGLWGVAPLSSQVRQRCCRVGRASAIMWALYIIVVNKELSWNAKFLIHQLIYVAIFMLPSLSFSSLFAHHQLTDEVCGMRLIDDFICRFVDSYDECTLINRNQDVAQLRLLFFKRFSTGHHVLHMVCKCLSRRNNG